MKTDKAFLKLGSKTIIEELISRLEKRFTKIMIIANDKKRYAGIDIEVIVDIISDKGPLGGIYTGLLKSNTTYNFIFSCDAPFVNLDLIDYMIDLANGIDIVAPRWRNRFEPLHAIYSRNCIGAIERQIKKNDLKITNFFPEVSIKVVGQEELERFNLGETPFMNINTREEYGALNNSLLSL
jgi:molybdopterin-guanine dinucleotide biosynthesis protein A